MKSAKKTDISSASDADVQAVGKPWGGRQRGRTTVALRLQQIIEQQSQLSALRRALAAQQRAEEHRRQIEINKLVGAIVRRDVGSREFLRAVLNRCVSDAADRALLKSAGLVD
jgi:hypothetical protein